MSLQVIASPRGAAISFFMGLLRRSTPRNDRLFNASVLVDQIFKESLPRARKERQIAPQASAGYLLSINPLFTFRKEQRGRGNKASKKLQTYPPQLRRDMRLMIASKLTFLPGP